MIRVYTFADKRPDFIKWQKTCIEFFFPKDTSFTVFNNGYSELQRQLVKESFASLLPTAHCQLFELPKEAMDHRNPNAACSVPLNWAWQNVIAKDLRQGDIGVILDSDMFPVAPFDPEQYLTGYILAGTKQKRGQAKYIWNGIMIFGWNIFSDVFPPLDFNYGDVDGDLTDVGGYTHYFFKKRKDIADYFLKNIHHTSHIHNSNNNLHCIPEPLREKYDPEFRMEIYTDCFLHYGRGSNWDKMPEDYHTRKTTFLAMAITKAIAAYQNGRTIFGPHGYIFSENEWEKK